MENETKYYQMAEDGCILLLLLLVISFRFWMIESFQLVFGYPVRIYHSH